MSSAALPPGDSSPPGEAASGLEVRLFGPTEVRAGGRSLPRLRSRKGQWLLALLALRAGRDVDRDWLAGTLWPDCDEADGRHSLRQSLYDLRLALGAEARRLTGETSRTLRLDLTGASVDVLAFDTAVRSSGEMPVPSEEIQSLEAAVRLYRGPLLEDCAEEWVLAERRPREQAYLAALEKLAVAAASRGAHPEAAGYLRLAVGVDPYREDLQRALMEALAEGGSPAGALLVYRQYSTLLQREMAAQPSEATTSLFRQLREETRLRAGPPPVERRAAAPLPSPARGPQGNLPQPLSAFVGRDKELRDVALRLEHARLVTLTGTGGIGKTRLAVRVAEVRARDYADGAWFVDLAPLGDAALVPQAVAQALRVREEGGSPLTETLREALGARHLLLVLDNCEHLIDACACLADTLLSRCPQLHILATSRQPLGLSGEISWPVPPLSLPEPAAQETWPQTPAALLEFEAVRLLVERAAGASSEFALGEDNAAATLQVCRRLDGIPLAIELAAARLKVLSVEQVAARLDDRFRLLTGGCRAALPRQQTLRATLDWSYDLLQDSERILLRRLGVFPGGFTLEAAEAVCADSMGVWEYGSMSAGAASPKPIHLTHAAWKATGGYPTHTPIHPDEVLDLLTSLLDRSLVRVERRAGAARYALLETTREYARERLREAGESDPGRARHAQFFLALAERAAPELRGAAQAEWLHRLDEEHDNFRAPLDHFLAQRAVEDGLRLGGALGWFWWMRGYFSEGRERLQALLTLSGYQIEVSEPDRGLRLTRPARSDTDPYERRVQLAQAKALSEAGMLADEQSDYAAARALCQESLSLARELGDLPVAATALNNLGGQAMRARDYPAARALYEESLAIWRGIGDRWWTAAAFTNLGRVALCAGECATARALVDRGLEIQRQLQDRRAIARSLTTLGGIAERLGDQDAAYALYEESLALARELGARAVTEEALRVLGTIARDRGDAATAVVFHEERLAIARDVGSTWGIAESLYYLGLLARDRGEGNQAVALWSESLSILQRLGEKEGIAQCLEGFASLATRGAREDPGLTDSESAQGTGARVDSARRAARLFGAADALRERSGTPVTPRRRAEYERQVAAARAMLDEAAFTAAWAEGQAMPLEQALADAPRGR